MAQINRRVKAIHRVQEAILELTGIVGAEPPLIEAITSLREVRKELAYEIFRGGEMSDEEKKRRCDEAYKIGVETSDTYPSICRVDGKEYTYCYDCPLRRG